MSEPVHYLDLNGAQAHSLSELGGSPELWAGVTKLYASNGALRSLQGLELLCNVRFLYLDHNELPERELLMLSGEFVQYAVHLDKCSRPSNALQTH